MELSPVQTLNGHTGYIRALVVGPNGNVRSGSEDGTIRVWCGDDGTHLHTLEGHGGKILSLVVGRNGSLYSGHDSGKVFVW